jgi:hypothetical protein
VCLLPDSQFSKPPPPSSLSIAVCPNTIASLSLAAHRSSWHAKHPTNKDNTRGNPLPLKYGMVYSINEKEKYIIVYCKP